MWNFKTIDRIMKKIQIEKAVTAYRVMNTPSFLLSKMAGKSKFAVLRALGALKRVATDYDSFLDDVSKRLRPEGYDAIAQKQQGATLTEEEQTVARRYQQDLAECLQPELMREVDVALTDLTEDELAAMLDSNPDLPLSVIGLLCEVLGAGEDAPEEGAGDAV